MALVGLFCQLSCRQQVDAILLLLLLLMQRTNSSTCLTKFKPLDFAERKWWFGGIPGTHVDQHVPLAVFQLRPFLDCQSNCGSVQFSWSGKFKHSSILNSRFRNTELKPQFDWQSRKGLTRPSHHGYVRCVNTLENNYIVITQNYDMVNPLLL